LTEDLERFLTSVHC